MTLENVHPTEIIQLELQKQEACAEAGIEYQRDHIAEQRILQDPENALLYARTVLKGRWPELEEVLVQMPVDLDDMNDFSNEVWDYVLNVANRPIPALEKHFLHNPEIANFYQVWSQENRRTDADSDLGFTTVELARSRNGQLISEFDEFWPGVPPRVLQLTPPLRVHDFEDYIGQRRNAHRVKLGLPAEAPRQSRWKPSGGNPSSPPPSSPPPSAPALELAPGKPRPTLKDALQNRIDGYRAEHPVEIQKQEIRWKKEQPSAPSEPDSNARPSSSSIGWKRGGEVLKQPGETNPAHRAEHPVEFEKQEIRWKKGQPSTTSEPDLTTRPSSSPIGWKRDGEVPKQPGEAGPAEEIRWQPKLDKDKTKDLDDDQGPTFGM